MLVCNAAVEKCPKVADNFFITINKNCPNVADNFSKQKLSANHFLCPRLCRRVAVFLPWG